MSVERENNHSSLLKERWRELIVGVALLGTLAGVGAVATAYYRRQRRRRQVLEEQLAQTSDVSEVIAIYFEMLERERSFLDRFRKGRSLPRPHFFRSLAQDAVAKCRDDSEINFPMIYQEVYGA